MKAEATAVVVMSRLWREKVVSFVRGFRTESYERRRSSRVCLKGLDAVDCICCAIAVSEVMAHGWLFVDFAFDSTN